MSNQKNTTPVENTPEKAMTKYDRKMQARREAELREKKQSKLTKLACIAIIVLIAAVAIAIPVSRRINANKEYVRIGNHSINQIEYGFYYGYSVNTFLSSYASILPYMGLDTTADFSTQMFDETTTWAQYFNQITLTSIRQYLALADDAAAKDFEYDETKAYDDFYATMKSSADEEGISLSSYLKQVFGKYATKSSIKDSVKVFLTSQAYYTHLYEENTPSEEEVTAHYEANKNDYDNVDYRVFPFSADTEADVTEEDIEAAMVKAKEQADAFAARVEAGENFTTLCAEYASEEDKEDYTAESDASLRENTLRSSVSSAYSEWLFDAARAAGDITVIEDAENLIYYVVSFISRDFDAETQNATISDTLASEATQTYLSSLTANYQIEDKNDAIDLPVVDTTENTDTAEDAE